MEKTSQDLMHEHEAILNALDVIEKMYEGVKKDKKVDYKDIEEIIVFLKVFADKCHHGKEEKFLFPALEEAGVKNQDGPIGVMLEQHKKGREFIKQMQNSIKNNTIDKDSFVEAASLYVSLLRNHIDKENKILFPMSDAKLSASKQKELFTSFEKLEKEVIGEGVHEKLHKVLERLEKKYMATT